MKALPLVSLVAALVATAACGGNDADVDAGGSVEPGPTGTIESTTEGIGEGDVGSVDGEGIAAPSGQTPVVGAPSAAVSTAPNAPPAMTSPATEGDTTVRVIAP